jgi:hypothetical protein
MKSEAMKDVAGNLPTSFRKIRLELAREPGHPEGDHLTAYEVLAPLDAEGRLDVETALSHREACRVTRIRRDLEPEHGYLRRRPGGSWAFHYDFDGGGEDDDPGYRFSEHRFVAGEYVTVQEDEGPHTYRVITVRPL